jgi:gliding motility-associated-like protein
LTDAPLEEWFGVTTNDECITQIVLANNSLLGTIPPELGQLDNLGTLLLNNNQIQGEVPPELGRLNALTYLSLFENNITGTLPPELGQLRRLEIFFCDNNELLGSIPSELGSLTSLVSLRLNNNMFTGTVPSELNQLINLTRLYLHSNQLESCFAPELLDLCFLETGDTIFLGPGYSFLNNPALPYQGDFERICNGESQGGGTCNDDNSETENDIIDEDCNCNGQLLMNNELETYAPSGFTPNNDGTNDLFIIPALDPDPEAFEDNELTVFNRWGQIVYHAKPYRNDWDGTHHRTNIDLPVGTYFFTLKLDIGDGILEDGHITILR